MKSHLLSVTKRARPRSAHRLANAAVGVGGAMIIALSTGAGAVYASENEGQSHIATATDSSEASTTYWTTARQAQSIASSSPEADMTPELSTSAEQTSARTHAHAVLPYVGELFFVQGGKNRACTATVINTPDGDTIATAASCLIDRGAKTVHRLATFVPSTDHAAAPQGIWPIRVAEATPQWNATGATSADVAFAKVAGPTGTHLKDAAGSVPAVFDTITPPATELLRVFAYPQEKPYSGQKLVGCGAIAHRLAAPSAAREIGCDINDGAMGGPALSPAGELRSVIAQSSDQRVGKRGLVLAAWGTDAATTLADLSKR